MRGDRPDQQVRTVHVLPFTPHARGSTTDPLHQRPSKEVYPACAGIDLTRIRIIAVSAGLPRMRGDRPIMV